MKNKLNIWFFLLVLVLGLSLTSEPRVILTEVITIKDRGEGVVNIDLRNEYDLILGVRLDIQVPLDTANIKYKKL